jgi:hypothetical protein
MPWGPTIGGAEWPDLGSSSIWPRFTDPAPVDWEPRRWFAACLSGNPLTMSGARADNRARAHLRAMLATEISTGAPGSTSTVPMAERNGLKPAGFWSIKWDGATQSLVLNDARWEPCEDEPYLRNDDPSLLFGLGYYDYDGFLDIGFFGRSTFWLQAHLPGCNRPGAWARRHVERPAHVLREKNRRLRRLRETFAMIRARFLGTAHAGRLPQLGHKALHYAQ